MADLSKIPLDTLQVRFPAQATWIYELAKGDKCFTFLKFFF